MIKLELELAEVNGLLEMLGNGPYKTVVNLINKIQTQAIPQVKDVKETPSVE